MAPRCAICGTTEQLLRCSSCKTAYYCSSTHQHIDWPSHRQECRLHKQKNNNVRIQQLQQAVAAATLSSNNMANSTVNAVSTANLHYMQQQQLTNGGSSFNPPAIDIGGYATTNGDATITVAAPQQQSVILGTSEKEILQSQAETVSPNSNSGYYGSFDANSTTSEQVQYRDGGDDGNNVAYGSSIVAAVDGAAAPPISSRESNLLVQQPQQILHYSQPAQQQQQQQSNQQYHHHQHQFTLTNHNQNQIEKSSSYQIGRADENVIGNANERRYEELCRNIINDMNQYGLSVVDDFLGTEKGLQILSEVHCMYSAGVFKDGQLVNNLLPEEDLRTIRGDKITWVKGVEPGCASVGYLINQIDAVICRANMMRNNGKLGNYSIKERTKAMVACYPGSGSHYIMHVDNPNKDGRVITAIYYLNVDWDTKCSGGVLRIFPEHGNTVADIEPKFDRLIFFWSDKRNPHEVQPAHRTRYAITVWYFDANEREAALNRAKYEHSEKAGNNTAHTAIAKQQQQAPSAAASNTTTRLRAPATAKTTASALSSATATNANTVNANSGAIAANAMKLNLSKMANTNATSANQICT